MFSPAHSGFLVKCNPFGFALLCFQGKKHILFLFTNTFYTNNQKKNLPYVYNHEIIIYEYVNPINHVGFKFLKQFWNPYNIFTYSLYLILVPCIENTNKCNP